MNANHMMPPTGAGPTCAVFAPLLPLLSLGRLDAEEAAAVGAHAAACISCGPLLAEYGALRDALRRGDLERSPHAVFCPPTVEKIMATKEPSASPTPIYPPERRPNRGALLGALAAVLVVALLAGAIFATRGPAGVLGGGATPTPRATVAPTPTLAPGADQITFVDTAPWGVLTINGRTVERPQEMAPDYTLPRGHNVIVYSAPPFPTLRCIISVPATLEDTCTLHVPQQGGIRPAERIVELTVQPRLLAPRDLSALVAATQHALDASTSTTDVIAGDHYVNADGRVAVASDSFRATLSFVVPTQPVTYSGAICAPFCLGPGPQQTPGSGLHLVIFPTPQWQFTAPSGQQWTIGEKPTNGNAIDILINWNGSLQVAVVSGILVASTGLEVAMANFPPSSLPGGAGGGSGCAAAAPPAQGCVIKVFGGTASDGLVLYHFGVSVAANAAAQQLYPSMPVASPHEAALAAQLAKQL
jgi:hypothetical protein